MTTTVNDIATDIDDRRDAFSGLALAANVAALRALRTAIRVLEDDAAGLTHMSSRHGDRLGASADSRCAKAAKALESVDLLRGHARRAQGRVDALSAVPVVSLRAVAASRGPCAPSSRVGGSPPR